jgi:hypothetical protein
MWAKDEDLSPALVIGI